MFLLLLLLLLILQHHLRWPDRTRFTTIVHRLPLSYEMALLCPAIAADQDHQVVSTRNQVIGGGGGGDVATSVGQGTRVKLYCTNTKPGIVLQAKAQ